MNAPTSAPSAGTDQRSATVTLHGRAALTGSVQVPGDKSISHRVLILAALSHGRSVVTGLSDGADVRHTLAAVEAMGAHVQHGSGGAIEITGGELREPDSVIDVGNSGTGIRLLAGVAAGLPGLTVLVGDASIARRPMDRIAIPLRLMGARIDGRGDGSFAPLAIRGRTLSGIDYDSPVASAQVKSAILLAGLSATGVTTVREPLRSRAHTEEMLAARGAAIDVDGTAVTVTASTLEAVDEHVAGDPSQAAFWLIGAAAIPGSDVTTPEIYLGHGRDGFVDVLKRMGADLTVERADGGHATVRVRHSELRGVDIYPDEVPALVDELPAIAAAAAVADGVTRINGASELRHKETDRIATIAEMLRGFGVGVEEYDDGLAITGVGTLSAGATDSRGDHRIAMSAAILSLAAAGTSTVSGFDAVDTSYPGFLADLVSLTGPEVLGQ